MHLLNLSVIGNQLLFHDIFETHVLFYSTVDRKGCVYSVKFECYFLIY